MTKETANLNISQRNRHLYKNWQKSANNALGICNDDRKCNSMCDKQWL